MFTVYTFDEFVLDDVKVFEGTLEECREYVGDSDEFDIIAPDGFTSVD